MTVRSMADVRNVLQYDAEDMELDQLAGLAPPPPPSQDPQADAQPRREKKEAAEAIPRDTEDAYEECYPDYGGFAGAVVDSDDEDLSHMDSKEGKSRYDFETEEQWEVDYSIENLYLLMELQGRSLWCARSQKPAA